MQARNFQQRELALCIPYEIGEVTKSFYPDFVIVRKHGGVFVIDVLEPHNMTPVDTVPKAIGLAKVAISTAKKWVAPDYRQKGAG
ncbi:MAG: hypothetical protein ABIR24_02245 [Verrucomicrobiota bacterium]